MGDVRYEYYKKAGAAGSSTIHTFGPMNYGEFIIHSASIWPNTNAPCKAYVSIRETTGAAANRPIYQEAGFAWVHNSFNISRSVRASAPVNIYMLISPNTNDGAYSTEFMLGVERID